MYILKNIVMFIQMTLPYSESSFKFPTTWTLFHLGYAIKYEIHIIGKRNQIWLYIENEDNNSLKLPQIGNSSNEKIYLPDMYCMCMIFPFKHCMYKKHK